jgi:Protein of unknown function (DUF2917)
MTKSRNPIRRLSHWVLNRHEPLVLANAQGTVVAVDRGSVWITQERDPRDIVLVKGMRFEIDRPGRTIVAAEKPSTLRLLVPERLRDRLVTALRRTVARVFGRWGERRPRYSVPHF